MRIQLPHPGNQSVVHRHFARLGAQFRYKLEPREQPAADQSAPDQAPYNLHLDRADAANCFELSLFEPRYRAEIMDAHPQERHLLLLVRDLNADTHVKFLCGHDERHWFIAAIPNAAQGVTGVATAREALKPAMVQGAQTRLLLPPAQCQRRHNAASHRQGEWFFLPVPWLRLPEIEVLRREPIRREGSADAMRAKPHMCQFLHRTGGQTFYRHVRGWQTLSVQAYTRRAVQKSFPADDWQLVRVNPTVHARGRITHPDHATLVLPYWHRVLMSTEAAADGINRMTFID